MSTYNIKISQLNPFPDPTQTVDFFPMVDSSSLTTYRASIADIAPLITHSIHSDSSSLTVTASYSVTASYVLSTGPIVSSSYSITASNSTTASYAITASNSTTASYAITSSYAITASNSTTASYAATASYISHSISASYAITASNSTTASYAITASNSTTASYAITASNTITASYAITASNTITASYALNTGKMGIVNTYQLLYSGSITGNANTGITNTPVSYGLIPTTINSIFLIFVSVPLYNSNFPGTAGPGLYRNSSPLIEIFTSYEGGDEVVANCTNFIDSPSTTLAVTYSVKMDTSTGAFQINGRPQGGPGTTASLSIVEIA